MPMPDTYLSVPFRDKDAAKALGARWDPVQRQWYVPQGRDLAPFQAWLPPAVADQPRQATGTGLALEEPAGSYALADRPLAQRGMGLSQLLSGVAQAVALAFSEGVWTRLEVVDARLRGGHVYLEVAERNAQGQVLAKSNAVIWASTAGRILPAFEQATGASLGAGIKLLVRARPVFKPQYGFSLEIDAIDPEYTLGDLEARKREIRERLQREGLYDRQRSLTPPWDFNRVLVLAPEGGAGLGDFQAEAQRLQQHGLCHFDYVYSRFQGEGAADEIRQRLERVLKQPVTEPWDAIVIIRGGGAVNDLAWLNDYPLARLLCSSDTPVLTGIGHERDSTVLDEVAHQRFDTPSKVIAGIEQRIVMRAREAAAYFQALAQTAQSTLQSVRLQAERAHADVRRYAQGHLVQAQQQIQAWVTDIRVCALDTVHQARRQASEAITDTRHAAQRHIDNARYRLPQTLDDVRTRAQQSLQQARERSESLMREIAGQGPEKTLIRGFAVVRNERGEPVTRASGLQLDQPLRLQFHDGDVAARVSAAHPPPSKPHAT